GFKFTGSINVSSKDTAGKLIGSVTNSISKTLTQLNKRSTNLNAEMLILLMGRLKSESNISFRDGIEFVDSLINLSGLNAKDYRISDGSGVSRYNLVSADLLTKLLIYIYDYDKNLFNLFFSTLPVSGVDGTLSYRMGNSIAKGKVFAKTGTLSGVSTLSGYIKRSNGNYFVFSILLQNYTSPSRIARDYIDKICEIITKH
ncbi:MAG: D-alanyl-D-alanine carboxypeptidase/D-alanyl-D-alanine-endopeptidase, partial [Ignavibacteriaceae bacterium]|nr:D-alanyl-D-alanine carboxypeptidase/D-alanyl-D-alanine-endopeptidase [Ignavibacteriaceae bacterium]